MSSKIEKGITPSTEYGVPFMGGQSAVGMGESGVRIIGDGKPEKSSTKAREIVDEFGLPPTNNPRKGAKKALKEAWRNASSEFPS